MALTDIIFYDVVAVVNRGNVGVVADTTASHHTMFLTTPVVTNVTTGVVYGPQNSLTGTSAGGGAAHGSPWRRESHRWRPADGPAQSRRPSGSPWPGPGPAC